LIYIDVPRANLPQLANQTHTIHEHSDDHILLREEPKIDIRRSDSKHKACPAKYAAVYVVNVNAY